MTILIVGSTGKIGLRVVQKLAVTSPNKTLKLLCRNKRSFPEEILNNVHVEVIEGGIMEFPEDKVDQLVQGCSHIISCLGHRGGEIFSPPYNLVVGAAARFVNSVRKFETQVPVKFIWVGTTLQDNPNGNDKEIRTCAQNALLTMLHILPPHRDNIKAAKYFYEEVGDNDSKINWCMIRPGLLTEEIESPFEVHENLQTGLFDARTSARENVARFMVNLVEDSTLWNQWKNKYPVILDAVN